jgi:heme-degrading monooxygenase HmoA
MPMIVQVIRFESPLDYERVLELARERSPEFEKLPGLVQKYYTRTTDQSRYAGIYVWDSAESLEQFRASELAAGIPETYQVQGTPEIEVYEVAFCLRE